MEAMVLHWCAQNCYSSIAVGRIYIIGISGQVSRDWKIGNNIDRGEEVRVMEANNLMTVRQGVESSCFLLLNQMCHGCGNHIYVRFD